MFYKNWINYITFERWKYLYNGDTASKRREKKIGNQIVNICGQYFFLFGSFFRSYFVNSCMFEHDSCKELNMWIYTFRVIYICHRFNRKYLHLRRAILSQLAQIYDHSINRKSWIEMTPKKISATKNNKHRPSAATARRFFFVDK